MKVFENWRKIGVILSALLMVSTVAFAEEEHRSIEQIVKFIQQDQKITNVRQIDVGKVPEALLEELGDSVMSLRHPNEQVHEAMDGMMGGEGSESLKAAHSRMGLGYLYSLTRKGGFGMGNGMMGFGYGGIMGIEGWIFPLVFLILVGVGIYFLIKNQRNDLEQSPLEIAKERYAKGEISEEEFGKIKKNL